MLFSKNDNLANERIIYETKPNMIFGCKKAIYGFILLAVVLFISPIAIQFIGKMQVYLISQIKLSLTRYTAIGLFVVILIIILYIIWQLISWYSLEYTLTDSKIIIKSGVISTKKNYMPYATIQDINTSQSIFAKIFNVGSVSLFSAYDNNQMELTNISNPSKVEEIIFSNMMGYRSFNQQPQQRFVDTRQSPQYSSYNNNYVERNDYYDDFEPITPIGHERNNYPRREYEYYPENLDFNENTHNVYEYEPYDDGIDESIQTADNDIYYESPKDQFYDERYNNEMRGDYMYGGDDYHHNNEAPVNYNGDANNIPQRQSDNADESSEKVIRRHFDKFKR